MLMIAGAGIVHCPTSNINLGSGNCPVRKLLNAGVKVGLGTDISGGYSPSMLVAIRDAICVSQAECFKSPNRELKPLSYAEAFYLATLGGAEVLSLDNKVGNFVAGKEFDAILVDVDAAGGPIDTIGFESLSELFQKFLFTGDDRNITSVYVKGRTVVPL